MLAFSTIALLGLVGIMVFSPFSTQFPEAGTIRSASIEAAHVDNLCREGDYQQALQVVDSLMDAEQGKLLAVPFFDRYLPEQERYEASLIRRELYELQWTRIEILSEMGDAVELRRALRKYCSVIGFHQDEARQRLKLMEDR